ncbi:hypothetical protein BO71DRAFT_414844 [Aspergillus ellipticus CBS 707.79]|uniref:Uncharacterized protein n=1 Tax=Aspergillus ellipticus CBS 707.79 TaxID=1448320 RepID=A0A319CSJ4_9EURO|nr:hypothetical protein BO71DRAFT_414844 [Aspergillus ellipticus CBS 707.79]
MSRVSQCGHPKSGQLELMYTELLQIFHISRKSLAILVEVSDWVKTSDLAILITTTAPAPAPVGHQPGPDSSSQTSSSNLPPFLADALQEIIHLNTTLRINNPLHPTEPSKASPDSEDGIITALFWWIFTIPAEFLELLGERQPFAMVILAFFCALMHRLHGQWWMNNWAEKVIHEIQGSLDGSFRSLVPWGALFGAG